MRSSTPTPDLSVVIGVYEGADHLADSLDGVLCQDGPRFEVILVNDGSGELVSTWLRELARRSPSVRLLEQDNQGLTSALIRGCAAARAPVIVRHDIGDRSLPGRFDALLAELEADSSAAMVSSHVRQLGPRGEHMTVVRRGGDSEENRTLLLTARQGPPHHGATAFRRSSYEQVGGYRRKFIFAQDADLWLRLAEVGSFACVQEILYECTYDLGGISATRRVAQSAFGEYAHACRSARLAGVDDPPAPHIAMEKMSRVARRTSRAAALHFVGACLTANGDPRGRSYLLRALGECPWRMRSWVRFASSVCLRSRSSDLRAERPTQRR
ncbi:MAG: glycosyltransferase [Planctomycetes bacterium]|nr:glycosyltransferase [Planctomycetota bacterium]